MDCILAIDIGTTSSKGLVVRPDGMVLASSQQGYPTHYPKPGYAEQNPTEIYEAVVKVIRACASQHAHVISAISFSSAMHSLMAVDGFGSPLSPLIIWADSRSAVQANRLRNSPKADFIFSTTGTPIHPMSPLCKLVWMKDELPMLINNAARFISIKEFVIQRLSGEYVVDFSVASATGLFDLRQLTWSKEVLGEVGLAEHQLSICASPYTRVPIPGSTAAMLGVNRNVKLVLGASDGCLANLGSGAMGHGDVSLTIGTSGAVRMASKKMVSDAQGRVFTYCLDDSTFIVGGATNNGLVLLDWFQQMTGGPTCTVSDFGEMAGTVEAGSRGLIFLPYVFGERSPYYSPDMSGVFAGLTQRHTKAHLMRALVEGICFELRSITSSLEDVLGPIQRVYASGGFTHSIQWLQILANILNKEICLRDVHDASALGAALMGFRSLGISANLQTETEAATFLPESSCKVLYDDLYAIFSRTTLNLLADFVSLAKLQRSGEK